MSTIENPPCDRADLVRSRGDTGFIACCNKRNTERQRVFQANLGHIHIARLKYLERHGAAGKQNGT